MNPVPKRLVRREQRVEDRSYPLDRLVDFRVDLQDLVLHLHRDLDKGRDSSGRPQDLLEVDSGLAAVGLAVHRGYPLLPCLLLDLDLDPERRRQE